MLKQDLEEGNREFYTNKDDPTDPTTVGCFYD
jgi:hypothetical protein